MNKCKFLVCLLCMVVCVQGAIAANEWRPEISKNGIDAYSRYSEDSPILEIRAITVVDARMEEIAELLRDVPANPQWRPNCVLSQVVEMRDKNNMTTYNVTDLPWPVADRDVIVKAETSINFDTARVIVNLKAVDHATIPDRQGYVRIKEFWSQYLLEYIDREKTGIVFTTKLNPGGYIPVFFINMFSKQYAYDEMFALTQKVKEKKYKDAGLKSEDKKTIENMLSNSQKIQNIFKARLSNFIKDKDFVSKITNDKDILASFGSGNGEIDKMILYGMGSRDAKTKAVQRLLEEYLKKFDYKPALVKEIVEDPKVINMILDGEKIGNLSYDELISSTITRRVAIPTADKK